MTNLKIFSRSLTLVRNSSALSPASSPASPQPPDSVLRSQPIGIPGPCEVGCDQDSVAYSPLLERRRWRGRNQRRNFDASIHRGSFAGATDGGRNFSTGHADGGRQTGNRPGSRCPRRSAGRGGRKRPRRNFTTTCRGEAGPQDCEAASTRSQGHEVGDRPCSPKHQAPRAEAGSECRPPQAGRRAQRLSTSGGICGVVTSIEPHAGMRHVAG